MKIPTDKKLRSDAGFLGFSDADVERLIVHARRARTGSTGIDGYKSTHGAATGGRPSGISDPTATMATGDERATPEVEQQHRLLFDMVDQAASSKRAVRNTLERLGTIQTQERPREATCCEPGCEDLADKAGRCNTDYMRKYRWEETHPGEDFRALSPDELAEREATRRQRRAS